MNFNQSTQEMIGHITGGMRVETTTLDAATYLTNAGQTELFNIHGRILVKQLFIEVVSALSNHATTLQFNCTFTTPVIAKNAMGAACASIAQMAAGGRVVHVGGAVATAAVITDSAGLSDVTCVTPHIVGGLDFVGTIGVLGAAASITSGTFRAAMLYVPYSDGAYAEAAL